MSEPKEPFKKVDMFEDVPVTASNSSESPTHSSEREIELLKWKLNQFKPYGSDDCKTCETGRVTLFIANEQCLSCAPETYAVPEHLALTLTAGDESTKSAELDKLKAECARLREALEKIAKLSLSTVQANQMIGIWCDWKDIARKALRGGKVGEGE